MKTILFTAGLPLIFICAGQAQAAMTEIAFPGEVTVARDRLGAMWEQDTVLGKEVSDRFLPDAAAAGESREEEYYFWWWDISHGAARSETQSAVPQRRANNLVVRDERAGKSWLNREVITRPNGPGLVGRIRASDVPGLQDSVSPQTIGDQGYNVDPGQEVEILDNVVDGIVEPPLMAHPVLWRDVDSVAPGQSDNVYVLQPGDSIFDPVLQQHQNDEIFDNEFFLRVTEVASRPAKIFEPGSSSLLLLGLMGLLWLRVRRG